MSEGDGLSDAGKTLLGQDPHAVHEPRSKDLELAIGHEVRRLRKKLGLTVADLAGATGMSVGALSKVENGNISASLGSLQAIARGLGAPITALFRGYVDQRSASFVKAGQGVDIERRGTRAGHHYSLLGFVDANTSGVTVEPYLITLTTKSDIFPTFQHDGMEFIHMLEGEVVYRHGERLYRLEPGDSLFFDADAPHGPETLVTLPARYLSIISYRHEPHG